MTHSRTSPTLTRIFKMRTCKTITKALIVALVIALSPLVASAQEAAPFDGRSMPAEVQEGTLMFSFTKAEWKVVIEWFAEQTGLSWRALDEKFPKGSFTLNDSQEYTPLEALDQLNYALRLQDPPYTCLLYTSPSPRDRTRSRMPSSA